MDLHTILSYHEGQATMRLTDRYETFNGTGFFFEGSTDSFVKIISAYALQKFPNDYLASYIDIQRELYRYKNEFFNACEKIDKLGVELDGYEYIKKEIIQHPTEEERHRQAYACYLIPHEYRYYINLKSTTITLLALIMDIKFTTGLASTICTLLGINSKAFSYISDSNGERCLLIEILRKNGKDVEPMMFYKKKSCECTNNHLSCRYKKNGECTIQKEDVDYLFSRLVDKNVLSEIGRMRYKYNI